MHLPTDEPHVVRCVFLSKFTNQVVVNLLRRFVALHLIDNDKWKHKVGEMLQLRAVLDRVPDHLFKHLSSAFWVLIYTGSYLSSAYETFRNRKHHTNYWKIPLLKITVETSDMRLSLSSVSGTSSNLKYYENRISRQVESAVPTHTLR